MNADIPTRPRRLSALHPGLRHAALSLAAALLPALAQATQVPSLPGMQPGLSSPLSLQAPRYSRALEAEGQYRITADFRSLNGTPVSISFEIEQAAARQSMQAFGISTAEIDAMRRGCQATAQCDQAEFDQRLAGYFREHKLRLREVPGERSHLFVDIPEVVRHDRALVRPVAQALQQLGAEQGRDAAWVFDTAVALVQGGLAYRAPSAQEQGRQTLGFYTPPRALEKGYGDCDTKSALLASILLNLGETRIIGVRVPNHYLLGVARKPQPGEASLDYQGRSFVLLEAAGPAVRKPGEVSERTRLALQNGDDIRIDPMF